MTVRVILSGGQTGVDRAALDVAHAKGLLCAGWCPKGRLAEDGVIPHHYPLQQTANTDYPTRTRFNVRDSNATLILYRQSLSGGTALTAAIATDLKKPYLLLDLNEPPDLQSIQHWFELHHVHCLNVAGPRESGCVGVYDLAYQYLEHVL